MSDRNWLPVASFIISLCALSFSGFQAYEAHHHNNISLKPSVDFFIQTDTDEPIIGVAIINHGPGPAVIRHIDYYVNHKLVKDIAEAEEYGKINRDLASYEEYAEQDTMSVGETTWVLSRATKNKKELSQFAEFVDQHFAMLITFCSIDGECQTKCSPNGYC